MTREDMIVDAVLAALRAAQIPGVEGRVYERRGLSLAAADLPALDVTRVAGDVSVQLLGDFELEHELTLTIDVVVGQTALDAPDVEANRIAARVHQVVLNDATVEGLVRSITPGGYRYQAQSTGDGVVLRRTAEYRFGHVTAIDDLSTAR